MNFKEYSLKFIKWSKYTSSFVCNARDEMSHFMTGVFEELKEECRLVLVHDTMDLSKLVVHDQKVEKCCLRKRNRDDKRGKSSENGSSNSRHDVQDKPKVKKRFTNKLLSNFSKNRNDRGSNPKP